MNLPALIEIYGITSAKQLEDVILPLWERIPSLALTIYAAPNQLGDLTSLRQRLPNRVDVGMFGFEGTPYECKSWTDDAAEDFLHIAENLGYDPILRPPNWAYDEDVLHACRNLDVAIRNEPGSKTLIQGIRAFPGPTSMNKVRCAPVMCHVLELTDRMSLAPNFSEYLFPTDLVVKVPA
jgi:hypothetical protein